MISTSYILDYSRSFRLVRVKINKRNIDYIINIKNIIIKFRLET